MYRIIFRTDYNRSLSENSIVVENEHDALLVIRTITLMFGTLIPIAVDMVSEKK